MRVLVIGATGTIGSTLCCALKSHHEVIPVARRSAISADLGDLVSLSALFTTQLNIDAVVSCAAHVPMAPLVNMTLSEVRAAVDAKLFGQVELVRQAAGHLNGGGSITLTSGAFSGPAPQTALGALTNAGLEAFAAAAATEMERGIRLNVVSPGWIAETLDKLGRDTRQGVPVTEVVACYLRSIDGDFTGRVLRPTRPRSLKTPDSGFGAVC
ncbi:short chain dehydrogenase [Nitratireductor sp. ZSWI3]|uniref:short chain dehydrogenase n=1 Tax=Nitratireductor sp. ZSWI3 TaxID=2966359 RepID=UPI00214FC8E0|nr:short chain dehydrogenase [Nitratireductor sp. ZSWI3]MCR4267828.1 short chain dehydrogenase [Nitratireductor sp. ZSWI3]